MTISIENALDRGRRKNELITQFQILAFAAFVFFVMTLVLEDCMFTERNQVKVECNVTSVNEYVFILKFFKYHGVFNSNDLNVTSLNVGDMIPCYIYKG